MNFLEKWQLKKEIKRLTASKKSYKLYKLVNNSLYPLDDILNMLTKEQVDLLTTGAMNQYDNDLIIEIAVNNKYANIDKIIKYLVVKFNSNYYDYEYHLSYFIGTHFQEFLNGALQNKNADLIFYLANQASYDITKYEKEIKRIKKYYLTYPVTKETIYIASLNGFNTEDIENKIITGSIYLFIEYLNGCSNPEPVIIKFFKSNPSLLNIKYFFHNYLHTDMLKTITNILLTSDLIDIDAKSLYLITLYSINSEDNLKEEITPIILSCNNLDTIANFMHTFNSEEQNNLCATYLNTNNLHILLNLAFTTDCLYTYKIIDKIILEHHHLIIPLLTNLHNRYLDYALDQIIKTKNANYFLNLIYTLKNENNLTYLKLIKFIYSYHYEYLFSKESLIKLAKEQKNNENLNLKK